MCVDFIDLNKACPKDSYPLPKIDKLADAIIRHAMLSFMNAFSGYHQIPLCIKDQQKTAFVIDWGLHYSDALWAKKHQGYLSASVNKIFELLLGKTMEVYLDNMIVKSMQDVEHGGDL